MSEVKLHGNWSSPFSYRVRWALALKGIPYEYIEEDLTNKTSSLLHYNPIHKKVPVLIHHGKPICESIIILQYIDETWPENPLLPADLFDRATARFWIQFIENKGPTIWKMFCSSGEDHEKAKRESLEILRIVEEQISLGDGKKFFGGEKIGMVDLAYGLFTEWLGVIEEVSGEKLIESDSFPRLKAWVKSFMEDPVIRENLPDREKMAVDFKRLRDRLLLLQPALE